MANNDGYDCMCDDEIMMRNGGGDDVGGDDDGDNDDDDDDVDDVVAVVGESVVFVFTEKPARKRFEIQSRLRLTPETPSESSSLSGMRVRLHSSERRVRVAGRCSGLPRCRVQIARAARRLGYMSSSCACVCVWLTCGAVGVGVGM